MFSSNKKCSNIPVTAVFVHRSSPVQSGYSVCVGDTLGQVQRRDGQ